MSAPPGFHTVRTTADGNCLFHSIFYAWFPEQGVEVANRTESAVLIRRIIADTIGIEVGLTPVDLEGLHESPKRKAEMFEEIDALDVEYSALRAPNDTSRMTEIDDRKFQMYKELILMSPNYWGGYKEIAAANKYARQNSLPLIYVWDQETRNWWDRGEQGMRIPSGESCRDWMPIANSRNIHFSICVKDEAPAAVSNTEEEEESESPSGNAADDSDNDGLYANPQKTAKLFASGKAEAKENNTSILKSASNSSKMTFLNTIVDSIKTGLTLDDFKELGYDLEQLREIGVSEEHINKVLENTAAAEKKKRNYNFLKAAGIADEDMWQYMGGKRSKRVTKKRKISKKKHTRKY